MLAYFGTPAIIKYFNIPASVPVFLAFWPLMIIGMVWQFVLSLILVYREQGTLKWQTISKRMWYNRPRNPKTGESNNWLFLWVIPFMALSVEFYFDVYYSSTRHRRFHFPISQKPAPIPIQPGVPDDP
jgi:hypothetical protein